MNGRELKADGCHALAQESSGSSNVMLYLCKDIMTKD